MDTQKEKSPTTDLVAHYKSISGVQFNLKT